MNKRYFEASFEVREDRGTPTKIVGKLPYHSESVDLGGFTEVLEPGCFSSSLANGRDIKAFWNHDSGKVIGSTRAGTLKLRDSDSALEIELYPGSTSWGKDALIAVSRGDVSGFSFAFNCLDDEMVGGVRHVWDADLFEVSPTGLPAYSESVAVARSAKNNKTKYFFSEESKREMKNIKKFWQEKEFKDHEDFLRTVAQFGRYNDGGKDWEELDHRLASGLDSAGYPTPDNFMYDLLRGPNGSELLRRCTTYQLGDFNNLKLPAVDEKTRSDSQYGGAKSYWEEEAEQLTDSKPDFRMVNLYVKKLISIAYVTDELLSNGIENYVFNTLSVSKARRIHQAIIHGTGAGQWLGIVKSGAAVVADAVGGQSAGTFVNENVGEMVKHLAEGSHGRDTGWLINPELNATLVMQQYNGVDQSGNLIQWRSCGERFNKMLGFDMIPCEACSAPGTVGDIVLADLSQYVIAEKAVKKQISGHVRFYNDESCFKLTYRADGAPAWATPVLSEKSGIQVSPFVVLAAR